MLNKKFYNIFVTLNTFLSIFIMMGVGIVGEAEILPHKYDNILVIVFVCALLNVLFVTPITIMYQNIYKD